MGSYILDAVLPIISSSEKTSFWYEKASCSDEIHYYAMDDDLVLNFSGLTSQWIEI